MENIDLTEIRKHLAFLPVLQERILVLQDKIKETNEAVSELLDQYKAEALDVDKLKTDSLKTLLIKNFGRYEEKMNKESEEMLSAKLIYDKACTRLKELEIAEKETQSRIESLLKEKGLFDEEIRRREEGVKSGMDGEISEKYRELEAEQERLLRRLAETEEAAAAARRAMSTAGKAMDHLKSAGDWATFDVWTRGGIISHIAKYQHIDEAEENSNRLNSQMEDLRKELEDISLPGVTGIAGIDSATRTIDFWFDNIFTDMNVRDRIGDDYNRMSGLRDKISGIVYTLGNDISEIQGLLKKLDQRKKDLLINGG